MLAYLKSKKFLTLAITFIFILIIVPLVFIFITHPAKQSLQNLTQKTQTPIFTSTDKLADFNGTPILVSDLNALALEQYQAPEAKTLNAVSVYNLLNTYVERKILDKQNLGDVSAEISKIEKNTGISGNQAKYQALREKFTATAPKSWSIYSIDFWLAPTNADGSLAPNAAETNPKQTNADRLKLLSDASSALDFAKTEMQKGTSVFKTATQINKNYPSLSKILAINGIIFNNSTNASLWSSPTVRYYDQNSANSPLYKTIYAMTNNSPVTKVLNDNNMGGSVVKIVKVNNPNGMLDSYESWLKNQESGLKITNDAILKLGNAK